MWHVESNVLNDSQFVLQEFGCKYIYVCCLKEWSTNVSGQQAVATRCLFCAHGEKQRNLICLLLFQLYKVTEKAFHKNAKTCRAGFHKKPTKQNGTHMTIRSQITIPTSIFPTTHTIIPYSLFWNGCVYMCVVNSTIGLWGLWVGVCIEESRE